MGQTEVSAIRTATRISPWATPEERDRLASVANFRSSARPEGNQEISRLQSTYGNQAVLRSVNSGTIFVGQTGSGSGAPPAPKRPPAPATPAQAAPAAPAPAAPNTINRIDFIDSPTGALGGFQRVKEGDLNSPGPFNSAGVVSHPLQIHFHLDKGNSANLRPRREIQMTASSASHVEKRPPDKPSPTGGAPTPGGFAGNITEPDGPKPHEIKRPDANRLVVADAPGALYQQSQNVNPFPIVIMDHFTLTIADNSGREIARVTYNIHIDKENANDVPNTENILVPSEKKDMVRGRDL